jgi:hypothetical protein
MRRLSLLEVLAVLFTGLAGLASAVQAYVSWETRGEVSRAIVFAQRIDACARVMAAIEPLRAKARPEGRAVVASGQPDGRYSLPMLYYGQSAGNAAFDAKHGSMVAQWRVASAAFSLVSASADSAARLAALDRIVTREIPEGQFMTRDEMVAWLEQLESNAQGLASGCRALL